MIAQKTQEGVQDFKKYEQQGAYHWTTLKPSYKISFNPYLHARYAVSLQQVPAEVDAGSVAIDLGCGDGYIANELIKRGYEVFGIDGSQIALNHADQLVAQKHPDKAHFKMGNVCDTQLKADSANLIISLDVIEHLDDPEAMLREMVRVGKNGATVLIGTPIRVTEEPLDKYHVQEFFGSEFTTLLSKHFKVLSVKKTHPIEWVALMGKKFDFLGKKKHLGWNLLNTYFLLTGKNPLAKTDGTFPTYQLAVCRLEK